MPSTSALLGRRSMAPVSGWVHWVGAGGGLKSKECPAGEKKCHKQVWWHNPVIPVIWGTKTGRSITS